MKIIDLRSDTVTRPSEAMRRAMAEAEVGDDVFGDDPTVIRLQELAAELMGKEDALFFPSGTMSNQTAINVLTRPGEELICETGAHVYQFESGGPAFHSGVSIQPIDGARGVLYADQVRLRVKDRSNEHLTPTSLICLENTHNRAGGRIYPLDVMRNIAAMARELELAVHLDGARIFNASVATGVPPAQYAACADTVNFCLSKGLGAPVGSMLVSTREVIRQARRVRKRLGGGMRQVGILAAAGIHALLHNVDRLADDHANAQRLARGLAEIPGLEINPQEVETNIVVARVVHERLGAAQLVEVLKTFGVLVVPFGRGQIRAVTHLDVHDDDIEPAVEAFRKTLR